MSKKYHIVVALMNLGKATFYEVNSKGQPGQLGDSLQITIDSRQAARLFCDIKANVLVPMHFKS
jgi:hypothetical protein